MALYGSSYVRYGAELKPVQTDSPYPLLEDLFIKGGMFVVADINDVNTKPTGDNEPVSWIAPRRAKIGSIIYSQANGGSYHKITGITGESSITTQTLTMLNLSSLTQDSSNLIITGKNLQIKSGSNVSASISTTGDISGSSLIVNTISVKSSSYTNTISYGDITNWNNAKPNQTFTAGTGIKLNGATSNVSTDTVSISVDGKLTDTTYSAGNGLSLSSNTFSVKLPTDSGLSSSSVGLILGTPGTISSTSTNTKTGITHSHELGTISVTKGGTGTGSFTSGNYLIGSGTNALSQKTPENVWIDVAGNSGTVSIAKGGTGKGSFNANQIIYGNNLTQSANLIYSSSKLGLTTNTTNLGKDDSVLQVGGNSKIDGSLKFGKLSESISNFQITWNDNVNTIDFNFFI